MDSHPFVAVSDVGAAPRYLEPEHLSDYVGHGLHYSSSMEKQIEFTESRRDDIDNAFSHQLVLSLRHPTWKYCNGSITDASCERSHHSHKNHTVQFSSVLLDENLEPRIYDIDVSRPFDQNHICNPQSVNLMDLFLILAFLDVAKEQIIKSNSSIQCPLVEMLPLFGGQIKVPVLRWGLNQTIRYLKRNGTFRRCSSLFIRTETPTEKKTVANGNGKGADNGSSKEVLSYQANDSLNAPAETPMSQSESSISSIQCPLVEMLPLFGGKIKVPVLRWGLNQKIRYLKWNGTFRRCSSLFIRTETPTEKKTVANGNGKGADNGSSKEVLSYQANDSLNAPAETPMSQSESSISRPDETATVDNSSATPTTTHEPTWYIVSAATHHMTGVQGLLIDYMAMSGELHVYTPNMGCMQVLGSGSVNTANVTLQNVWYVPGLDSNLVSTSQLTKLGYTVSLGPDGCRISKDSEDGALVGLGHFTDDDLCAVDFLNVEPTN